MDELHEVDAWLAALLSQLEPAARKKMLCEVARDVRRAALTLTPSRAVYAARCLLSSKPQNTLWLMRMASKQRLCLRQPFSGWPVSIIMACVTGYIDAARR